ncbi:MAG: hypothetical protein ACREO4_06385 [Lysobacter sp.]
MTARVVPALRLLGEGLDAIIQCTARAGFLGPVHDSSLPIAPTPEQRLERYETASTLFRGDGAKQYQERCDRGERLQHHWACVGFKPAGRSVVLFPRKPRSTRRALRSVPA